MVLCYNAIIATVREHLVCFCWVAMNQILLSLSKNFERLHGANEK